MFKNRKIRKERDELLQRIASVRKSMTDEIAWHHGEAGKFYHSSKTKLLGLEHAKFVACLETLISKLDGTDPCCEDCGCDDCAADGLVAD